METIDKIVLERSALEVQPKDGSHTFVVSTILSPVIIGLQGEESESSDMMRYLHARRLLLSLITLLAIVSCTQGDQQTHYSRKVHKIQHGQCSYTFILPEEGEARSSCREAKASSRTIQHDANSIQRDAPPPESDFPTQKIQQLENIMENYTQWLQKVNKEGGQPPMSGMFSCVLVPRSGRMEEHTS